MHILEEKVKKPSVPQRGLEHFTCQVVDSVDSRSDTPSAVKDGTHDGNKYVSDMAHPLRNAFHNSATAHSWYDIEFENMKYCDDLYSSQAKVCVLCCHSSTERIYEALKNDGLFDIGENMLRIVKQIFKSKFSVHLFIYKAVSRKTQRTSTLFGIPSSTLLGICRVVETSKDSLNHVVVRFFSLSQADTSNSFYDLDQIPRNDAKEILDLKKFTLVHKTAKATFPDIFVSNIKYL